MPSTLVGKNQLYYEVDGEGHPLILVAGYGCDLGSWEAIRKPLASHFQLIMLDNRGIGRSECPKDHYTVDNMADDVLALIKKLELKKPYILGHSMGGAVIQTIAYKYPNIVGKTIIAQSFVKLAPAALAALIAFLNLYKKNVPMHDASQTVLPWLLSDQWLKTPQLCELFLKLQSENPYLPKIEGLTRQYEALAQFDSQSWYSKITTSPLILAGSEDRLCPLKDSEIMAAGIPNSQFHIFQKVGHVAPLENPQEFCEVVVAYLNEP